MNKRKIFGIILVVFGLIMVAGSFTYTGAYKAMAPITMGLIVVVGLLMIYWDKIKPNK